MHVRAVRPGAIYFPLSPDQISSLDLAAFLVQSMPIDAPHQYALVHACRKLTLDGCRLDNGGQGLVNAIRKKLDFDSAMFHQISQTLPAVNTHLPDIIHSIHSIHSFAREEVAGLAFSGEFPMDDQQALQLFTCLHNQARYHATTPIRLELMYSDLQSSPHPHAAQFLVHHLSAFYITGDASSMPWLEIDAGDYAVGQLMASAVRDAVARSSHQTVALILTRVRMEPFPLLVTGDDEALQWLRDHVSAAVASATAAIHH